MFAWRQEGCSVWRTTGTAKTRRCDHRPLFGNGINLLAHYFRRRIVAHFGIQMLRARIDIECLRQYLAVLQGEAIGFQFESTLAAGNLALRDQQRRNSLRYGRPL